MAVKTPVRGEFDGNGDLTGLSEFQAADFIGIDDGGTGAILLEGETINYLIQESFGIQTQQPYADNSTFESDAGFGTTSTTDDILDFTERNPFGEVDEGF